MYQKLIRRLGAGLATAGLIFGGTIIGAAPASAAESCQNLVTRYEVTEASVPIVIGTLNVNRSACDDGSALTSSSTSLTFDTTGPGAAAGWNFGTPSTSLSGTSGLTAGYTSSGSLQLCVASASPLCADTETFTVTNSVFGPSFVGPVTLPTVACENAACKLNFARQ